MFGIRHNIPEVQAMLRQLSAQEIPTVLRNAVNDTARDVIKAEERQVAKVFDRPTPIVQRPFFLRLKATKEHPTAVVALKDAGTIGPALYRAISPHVPGLSAQRRAKPFEQAISSGSYWVPSRTAQLDRYGNVSKATIGRIIREVEVRGEQVSPSDRYAYLVIDGVEGIWDIRRLRRGQYGALVMVRARKTPTYRKRLDVQGVAQAEAGRVFVEHSRLAFEYAIRRRVR